MPRSILVKPIPHRPTYQYNLAGLNGMPRRAAEENCRIKLGIGWKASSLVGA
jgi:hypothetical protein